MYIQIVLYYTPHLSNPTNIQNQNNKKSPTFRSFLGPVFSILERTVVAPKRKGEAARKKHQRINESTHEQSSDSSRHRDDPSSALHSARPGVCRCGRDAYVATRRVLVLVLACSGSMIGQRSNASREWHGLFATLDANVSRSESCAWWKIDGMSSGVMVVWEGCGGPGVFRHRQCGMARIAQQPWLHITSKRNHSQRTWSNLRQSLYPRPCPRSWYARCGRYRPPCAFLFLASW